MSPWVLFGDGVSFRTSQPVFRRVFRNIYNLAEHVGWYRLKERCAHGFPADQVPRVH